MLGENPSLPDIVLSNLDCNGNADEPDEVGSSSLSPDSLGEEVEPECILDPYRVKTTCHYCDKVLRFIIVSSHLTKTVFEVLLAKDLSFLCPACVAVHLTRKNGQR
ncbi:E7 [Micromys minutus papillomavirus 1]|uniref:Protein E7 n=1 Tax=Micromys minutus papillomavirus TaxID=10568 RepID=A0EPK4_MMPV|nr:E7 [Micromys minutus papillomavirus 1]ABB85353.1 E7 [Micromys minutus papillomavirus 1]